MKVQTVALDEIDRIGIGAEGKFKLEFNAKMAAVLSDGLYSNKIKSVIRELSCNAYDSHVEAGKGDVPFEVHIPNNLEPWFHVKDFGVGLTNQQIFDIFTCYGISTKTDSNEVIGQLGLGSKSPFSLTNVFSVSARKDGIENHYSMYKDESGMPCVAHLGSVPTTECNGVTVKVPIRPEQRSEFIYNAGPVFRWFPVKPTIIGASKYDTSLDDANHKLLFEGAEWAIFNNNDSVALMGTVAYPLNEKNITGITERHRRLLQAGVVLKFKIGDFEVAANREAIGYNERTCTNICAKLNLVLNELTSKLQNMINSASTRWDAEVLFNKIFRSYDYTNLRYVFREVLSSNIKWNGITLSGELDFKKADFCAKDPATGKFITNIGCYRGACRSRLSYSINENFSLTCTNQTLIIFNDLEKGGIGRITERYYKNVGHEHEIWVFNPNPEITWEDMRIKLGSPNVIFTSSLPKVEVKKITTKVLRLIEWGNSRGTRNWEECTIDLEDGGFYVDLHNWDIQMFGSKLKFDKFMEIVREARKVNIIPNNTKIFAMRGTAKTKVKANSKWVELFTYIKTNVENTINLPNIYQDIVDCDGYDKIINQNNIWNAWEHNLNINDQASPMLLFVEHMLKLKRKSANWGIKCRSLNYLGGVFLIRLENKFSKSLIDTANEILRRYPMLSFIGNGYSRATIEISKKASDYINLIDSLDAESRKEVA